ncbi:hypothetical protein QQF64_002622 [Cirrhinus molitorella]|uniref:Placenta-specific gene 8 protein n=1 Tax=Cirrhinus molitorella TaxID=172907 RepID=A0ABR3MQR4_9TELE
MMFTSQPAAFAPTDFDSGLMSCCDDMSVCCYGYFCLPCLGCSIASDMNECCCCGLGMTIRSVYRTKYNIQSSLFLSSLPEFAAVATAGIIFWIDPHSSPTQPDFLHLSLRQPPDWMYC